jgi:coenzyme PQQ precursor peptide PqqA
MVRSCGKVEGLLEYARTCNNDLLQIFPDRAIALATGGRLNSSYVRGSQPERLGEFIMQWTAPAFEEVCLNCEINSYVSAKL